MLSKEGGFEEGKLETGWAVCFGDKEWLSLHHFSPHYFKLFISTHEFSHFCLSNFFPHCTEISDARQS